MAFVPDGDTVRLKAHPTEPETWAEVRPIRAEDIREVAAAQGDVYGSLDVLAKCLVSWSYSDPPYSQEPTRENIGRLDLTTYNWLVAGLQQASNLRPDDEKKESAAISALPSRRERRANGRAS